MEDDAVVGVTSNPTIFQKALAEGDAYDDQLRAELQEERDPKELFIRLAARDIAETAPGGWGGGPPRGTVASADSRSHQALLSWPHRVRTEARREGKAYEVTCRYRWGA